ncbi:MAG TPA: hypothetical protein DDY13_07235 [Cytophagales bacterium]|jgi:hypothetical protein|nr:hypothetical protein [Cytophagales bacterium]
MPLSKGQTNNPNGRPSGKPNKTTSKARKMFNLILEENLPQLREDILQLEPKDRIAAIIKIAEFCVPKLQAVQISSPSMIDLDEFIKAPSEERIKMLAAIKE